jgi:hypothetical protein
MAAQNRIVAASGARTSPGGPVGRDLARSPVLASGEAKEGFLEPKVQIFLRQLRIRPKSIRQRDLVALLQHLLARLKEQVRRSSVLMAILSSSSLRLVDAASQDLADPFQERVGRMQGAADPTRHHADPQALPVPQIDHLPRDSRQLLEARLRGAFPREDGGLLVEPAGGAFQAVEHVRIQQRRAAPDPLRVVQNPAAGDLPDPRP